MPTLSISIFHPEEGNRWHWALDLEHEHTSPRSHTMYEVTSTTSSFSENTITTTSSSSPANDHDLVHHRSIVLASINEVDLPTFRDVVAAARVDNETSHWNCQDYVLEILEALEEECVVGFDEDFDGGEEEDGGGGYWRAKREAMRFYGLMV
ncbi:hypothetical protein VTN00DRAFT_1558 [Thermoascus crustaceus]|uniref:uncharacterized protein n=1 Tax=Thermoascus crustaceus TaxID=5088 RepID=UPI003742D96F